MQANHEILQRRWRCRWGELDLIASTHDRLGNATLIFVEVKARRGHNWDEDGLLAITVQKQAKLLKAAQLFLAEQPQWVNCPCRFDVALVRCHPLTTTISPDLTLDVPDEIASWVSSWVEISNPVEIAGYQLSLQRYIQDAFDQG